jgi:hypothetical protein
MSEKLEIRIEGPKVTPERFLNASKAFLEIVLGVSHNLSSSARDEDWSVECDKGSSILRVKTDVRERIPAVEAVELGFHALNSGLATLPHGFTKTEIRSAKVLGELVDGYFIQSISFSNGNPAANISKSLAKTADCILSGEKYTAFGSLEGTIQTLHGREGYPVACYISDIQYKRTIVCHFADKQHEKQAVKAFMKRVLVGGLIHYSREGMPTSIDADVFREFPDEDALPVLSDVQAIYR